MVEKGRKRQCIFWINVIQSRGIRQIKQSGYHEGFAEFLIFSKLKTQLEKPVKRLFGGTIKIDFGLAYLLAPKRRIFFGILFDYLNNQTSYKIVKNISEEGVPACSKFRLQCKCFLKIWRSRMEFPLKEDTEKSSGR